MVEPVLFEREKNGYYEGHTMNYTQVIVKSKQNLNNKIVKVKIQKVDKINAWVY